jgi:hypothetical protein
MTDEVIKAYIESQSHNSDEVFRLEGGGIPTRGAPLSLSLLEQGDIGFSRNRRL